MQTKSKNIRIPTPLKKTSTFRIAIPDSADTSRLSYSDRFHHSGQKLQELNLPNPGSSTKRSMPFGSPESDRIHTDSSAHMARGLFTPSIVSSKRDLSLKEKLSNSSHMRSTVLKSYGSNLYFNELISPRTNTIEDFTPDTAEQDKIKSKMNSLVKKRFKLGAIELSDNKYTSRLKKTIFLFQELFSRVTNVSVMSLIGDIENHVYATVNYLASENKALSASVEGLQEQVEQAEFAKKKFMSQSSSASELEMQREFKERIDREIAEKEILRNCHAVEVQKLHKQNEILQEEVDKLIKSSGAEYMIDGVRNSNTNVQKMLNDYKKALNEKDSLATRYELMYCGARKSVDDLMATNKELEYELIKLQRECDEYKALSEKLEEKKEMYYNRSMMQLAEFEAVNINYKSIRADLKNLQQRFVDERERKRRENDEKLKQELEDQEKFEEEEILIDNLSTVFATTVGPGSHIGFRRLKEKEKDIKTSFDVDLKSYMIAKPSYDTLFSAAQRQKSRTNRKIDHDFMGTLRAIFDCKFNESLYYKDCKNMSAFPDFVYSWLGKYILDVQRRKTRNIDISDPDAEFMRAELIELLHSPIGCRLWDCVTFREFIDEMHTKDELLYFLHCRNLLFQGPQTNHTSATFLMVYYVKFDWAQRVVDYLLADKYDKGVVETVKARLKERTKTKSKGVFIDSGLFLRVMLEEYKNEKKEKLHMINKVLSQEPNASLDPSKFILSFESFSKFLNLYFPSVLELEKSELYRKAWLISDGIVDVDSILTALNEDNFFARVLVSTKFDGIKTLQKSVSKSSKEQASALSTAITKKFGQLVKFFELLKEALWEAGVETLTSNLQSYQDDFTDKLSEESEKGNQFQIYFWMYSMNSFIFRANQISSYVDYTSDTEEVADRAQKALSKFSDILKDVSSYQTYAVKELDLVRKVKVIQRLVRKKLSSWYKLMSFLIKTKVNPKRQKKTITTVIVNESTLM